MGAGYSKAVTDNQECCIYDADRRKVVQKEDTGADEYVFEARIVYHDCWCVGSVLEYESPSFPGLKIKWVQRARVFGIDLAKELYLLSENVIGGITIKYMLPITMVGRAGISPFGGVKVC